MTPNRSDRNLERIAFVPGSRLLEADLRDALTHTSRLQALHIRAVHDTWGVACGFRMTVSADRRRVLVGLGAAFTCRGAALVLDHAVKIDGPPPGAGAGDYDLLISTRGGEEAPGDRPPVGCSAPGGLRFSWKTADGSARRCRCAGDADAPLLLGRFVRAANGRLSDPDYAARPVVRGAVRPHVAMGVTAGKELMWEYTAVEWSAWVDTRDSGFAGTPYYFAWLTDLQPLGALFVGPFVSVGGASRQGFRLGVKFVMRISVLLAAALLSGLLAKLRGSRVLWIGVESTADCPPHLHQLWASDGSALGGLDGWLGVLAGLGGNA